ncbi:MAG: flavodoxin domain-containing protein [Solirubrobacteraceae bacterium]
MRVLVTAATRHGSSSEIAAAIAAGLNERGIDAEAQTMGDVDELDGYDVVVLGSAVYMGRWLKQAREFAKAHADQLAGKQVWLFSSGPLGPTDHLVPPEEPADTVELAQLTGAVEHRVFGGKLDKQQLSLAERAITKAVHAPEGDCRDWAAIDAFAGRIATHTAAVADTARGETETK